MKWGSLGTLAGSVLVVLASAAHAEEQPAAPEKEVWNAPFGGTWSATFAFATDYSYRGISQTQREVAVQPALGYESAKLSASFPISIYLGAWGSNVSFTGTGTSAEIDLLAGFKLKALDDRLSIDLGYIRYNYLGAPADLFYDFNELGLVVGYDLGVAQLSGALRYSPSFFANSGFAWYKWGQLAATLGRSASPPPCGASTSRSPMSTPTSTSRAAPAPETARPAPSSPSARHFSDGSSARTPIESH